MIEQERITTIEQLASKYANFISGYELITYYKGAFPVFRIKSEIVIQRKKELGLIDEFCLKFIRAGAKNINNVMNFLGLEEKVVESSLLNLHQLDMVNYRFATKQVVITSKGIDALEKNSFLVPEAIDYTFLIDGITGKYQRNESLDKIERIRKNSHVIPFVVNKPTMDSINLLNTKEVVNEQNRVDSGSYLDGEILYIKGIDKIEKLYRKLNVLVFSNNRGQYELMVFDFNKRQQDYEVKLMNMITGNYNILPTVTYDPHIDNTVSNKSRDSVAEIEESESIRETIEELEHEVKELESIEVDTEEEYYSKTMKIQELEKLLEAEKKKFKSSIKHLNTYDHRPILMDALKSAVRQVVIVSPWIKAAATDVELRGLIKNAIERECKVVICYGISSEIEADVKYAVDLLLKLKKESKKGDNLKLVKLGNTHEKVLICDDKYHVITSFNWLSFKGDPKKGFRQETGTYMEDKEKTIELMHSLQKRIQKDYRDVNIVLN